MSIKGRLSSVLLFALALALVAGSISTAVYGVEKRVGSCLCCPPGHDYCPCRYDSLCPTKDVFTQGEPVHIKLTGLQSFEYWIEKIEVYETGSAASSGTPIYTEEDVAAVQKDAPSWTWTWNQKDSGGNQVDTGRYMVKLKTGCCGYYRTYFHVYPGQVCTTCKPCNPCKYTDFDTDQNVYNQCSSVFMRFSICGGASCELTGLSIYKYEKCCAPHYEKVYSQNLQGVTIQDSDWTFTWDQTDNSGYKVPTGIYEIALQTSCCGEQVERIKIVDRCCQSSCNCCNFLSWLCGCCCN